MPSKLIAEHFERTCHEQDSHAQKEQLEYWTITLPAQERSFKQNIYWWFDGATALGGSAMTPNLRIRESPTIGPHSCLLVPNAGIKLDNDHRLPPHNEGNRGAFAYRAESRDDEEMERRSCHSYLSDISRFGDTTFTKVFVGGLAWETPTEEMRRYFEQFGEILEAVIITDKNTGKSKGYGFAMYNTQIQQPAQYYHQMYGTSSSTIGSPYYYGYSLQAPRAALSGSQAQRIPGPSYLYFPTSMEGSFSSFPSPTIQPARHPFPSSSTADSPTPQHTTTESEAGAVPSESPDT
ncbi:hypothetical protein POTOM_007889 [Populus tomentosa]|uniref:RRM domain-containing protein n=1 Tax=Populus tomentosa TaxID=118781 RepID=A0A8X8DDQ8_POPTO|nr:hypothetical protein POTOM_007889 [Populus tomentosa]